jgi:hypothetical protein
MFDNLNNSRSNRVLITWSAANPVATAQAWFLKIRRIVAVHGKLKFHNAKASRIRRMERRCDLSQFPNIRHGAS